jgi:beta-glucanase (GH16 family)
MRRPLVVLVVAIVALAAVATAAARRPRHDRSPPDTTITQGMSDTSSTDASFSFTGTDNIGVTGFQCRRDGQSFSSCTSPTTYSGLSAGSHTFRVRARDAAGNVDPTPAIGSWTITSTPLPTDSDGDGVPDSQDQCPNDPGPASNNGCPTGGGGSEPAPIAGQGYHEVFRDDFNTLNRVVWDDHIWYDESPSPAWGPTFQTAENGVLHLRTQRDWIGDTGQPYPYNTITTQTSGKTFEYGYFEARMKWPAGHGSWPGFWLYSYQHAIDQNQCTTQAGEVDVMEGQGSEPSVFYGTVHSNTNGCSPSDQQNGNNWQDVGHDLTSDFHTYAVQWTPSTVTWYLDGVETHSAPTYATDNQPMFLLLQEWVGGWTYDPDSSTPDVLDNQVDYVTVWQQ